MNSKILVTLGPSSLNHDIVQQMTSYGPYLYRVNLSHTPLDQVESTIRSIRDWTDVPICVDSEGAQIRNQKMYDPETYYQLGSEIKIHYEEIIGDSANISFTPAGISRSFVPGDIINVDFHSAQFKITEVKDNYCNALVIQDGSVGSNKAADLSRDIPLLPITDKDKKAISLARQMGVKHFALSFAGSKDDVKAMRSIIGDDATLISKVESRKGLANLGEIIDYSDDILIDRGDLSRQVAIEKIPFLQRRIIAMARSKSTPVYVATNLLESMVITRNPSRAELNDVVSTLLMGADGLVLAAETAVGKFPVEVIKMARSLIEQVHRWTPNSSIADILCEELPMVA